MDGHAGTPCGTEWERHTSRGQGGALCTEGGQRLIVSLETPPATRWCQASYSSNKWVITPPMLIKLCRQAGGPLLMQGRESACAAGCLVAVPHWIQGAGMSRRRCERGTPMQQPPMPSCLPLETKHAQLHPPSRPWSAWHRRTLAPAARRRCCRCRWRRCLAPPPPPAPPALAPSAQTAHPTAPASQQCCGRPARSLHPPALVCWRPARGGAAQGLLSAWACPPPPPTRQSPCTGCSRRRGPLAAPGRHWWGIGGAAAAGRGGGLSLS